MTMKKIVAFTALALSIAAPVSGFAASAVSANVPVSLTLAGSCTIDASLTSGVFADAVSGVSQTVTKSSAVNVNCTNTMPFKLGVTGGDNYTGSTRELSDSVHTPIPYVIKQGSTAFGDADILDYDATYLSTSVENAYSGIGTGAIQPIAVDFVATIPLGQASGIYADNVKFVVAWP